ncbi:hypothetical protein ACPF7Z_09030 [Halomonas sp. GXIMD04776]|uniref:hypothetical protein n=1 Tax=Halomonas sp. GXIMD04776 TaxID=3415605 RepID=UPI003C84DB47
MANSTPAATRGQSFGWLIWVALGLFVAFFLNVALERYWPGLFEMSPVVEACLLVLATACFISGCLSYERRRASSE